MAEVIAVVGSNSKLAHVFSNIYNSVYSITPLSSKPQDNNSLAVDFLDPEMNKNKIQQMFSKYTYVIFFNGVTQIDTASKPLSTAELFKINTCGIINILEALKELPSPPIIICCSSVTIARGKYSTRIYGATKSALYYYLEGLQQHGVMDIRQVILPPILFENDKSQTQSILPIAPTAAAKMIKKAISGSKNENIRPHIIWRLLYFMVQLTPSIIWNRLKL